MGSRAATERAARPETGVPMRSVCAAAPQLAGVVPYDPKYLPVTAVLSANENPHDVDDEIRRDIMREVITDKQQYSIFPVRNVSRVS